MCVVCWSGPGEGILKAPWTTLKLKLRTIKDALVKRRGIKVAPLDTGTQMQDGKRWGQSARWQAMGPERRVGSRYRVFHSHAEGLDFVLKAEGSHGRLQARK